MRILLVEDDPTLNANISEALRAEGYHVESVYDGQLAMKIIRKELFDCLILDVNLPGKNGFEICADVRISDKEIPIMMLTAFGDLEDKVKGFDSGADDYLTKPFFIRELIMRINALIKRSGRHNKSVRGNQYVHDDIILSVDQKNVSRQGRTINLTPREYQILLKLIEVPGEIVSKTELISELWGNSFDANTNTIEVYINFLRNKIDKPFSKQTIKTKVGFGYYLD